MKQPYVTQVAAGQRIHPLANMTVMAGGLSLEVAGRRVVVTHPDKVVFPGRDGAAPHSKLDLIRYYLSS